MFPPALLANIILLLAWSDFVISRKPQIGLSFAALALACISLPAIGMDNLRGGAFLWTFAFVFIFIGAIAAVAEHKRMNPFEQLD
jgi:hypothetical protein